MNLTKTEENVRHCLMRSFIPNIIFGTYQLRYLHITNILKGDRERYREEGKQGREGEGERRAVIEKK